MRNFAAVAATDATVVDKRNCLSLERIRVGFNRQRRASTQANAGMIAGAGIFVDAKSIGKHSFAIVDGLRKKRFLPALLVQHAF